MSKNQNIDNFKDFEFEIEYEDIIDKYANECVSILKNISPRNKYTLQRAKGKYAETWVVSKSKKRQTIDRVVWNEKNWQLTHLLEKGHLIVNKRGGVGWASPKPHISPAFERIKEPFEKAMQNSIIRSK